jgi:hypothetical protein
MEVSIRRWEDGGASVQREKTTPRMSILIWRTRLIEEGENAMKFLLAIKGGETLSAAEQKQFVEEHIRLGSDLTRQGKLVDSNPLGPTAQIVRIQAVKGGGRHVIDGPFAETKELLGGYYVIEAASRDEAVEWAKRIPLTTGSVEVYPIAKM